MHSSKYYIFIFLLTACSTLPIDNSKNLEPGWSYIGFNDYHLPIEFPLPTNTTIETGFKSIDVHYKYYGDAKSSDGFSFSISSYLSGNNPYEKGEIYDHRCGKSSRYSILQEEKHEKLVFQKIITDCGKVIIYLLDYPKDIIEIFPNKSSTEQQVNIIEKIVFGARLEVPFTPKNP